MDKLLKDLPTISKQCVAQTAVVLRYVGFVEKHDSDNIMHIIEHDKTSCVIGVQASKPHVLVALVQYVTNKIKTLGFVVESESSTNNCKLHVSVKEKKNATTIVKKTDDDRSSGRNDSGNES